MNASDNVSWHDAARPYLTFGPLVTPQDIAACDADAGLDDYSEREIASLASLATFMTGFLTQPNDELGRNGSVCPFTPGSLQRGLMSITASRLDAVDDQSLFDAMDALRDVFVSKGSTEDPDEIYRSISVVFPHLPVDEGSQLIERVQKALKSSYIAEGLMIGEFYPECPAPGLHNDAFRPLQAPEVCLSIRHMTAFDAPFMMDDDQHLSYFVAHYGADGERHARRAAAKRGCPHTMARLEAILAAPHEIPDARST